MDNNNNDNSGVNTVLIVLVLVLVVGAAVWFFTQSTAQDESGFEVDINLPAGDAEGEAVAE